MIFQIPKFLCVPESRVVGEHFGLLLGSGTRDPGEFRVTEVYISGFPLLFPLMEFSLASAARLHYRFLATQGKYRAKVDKASCFPVLIFRADVIKYQATDSRPYELV